MKKKIFIMIAAVMVFGLAVAVYALNSTDTGGSDKAKSTCCSGDSCPMKKAAETADAKASCCDTCACYKDGSCPMKAKHAEGHKMADGESCPMMISGDHKMTADHDAKAEHANCSCACCGTKEKKAESAV